MESPLLDGITIRLGVTLPSMKAEDKEGRLECVGVIGAEPLLFSEGGV